MAVRTVAWIYRIAMVRAADRREMLARSDKHSKSQRRPETRPWLTAGPFKDFKNFEILGLTTIWTHDAESAKPSDSRENREQGHHRQSIAGY
jgi:hypothetical protein